MFHLFSIAVPQPATDHGWRRRGYDLIHRNDTVPSRRFDLLLVAAILVSVGVVMLDSVSIVHQRWSSALYALEWVLTVLFTLEYALRLAVVKRPLRYVLSFWGLIDLLSILPTYLSLLVPGTQSLLVVRALRILRVFRILKLTRYVEESGALTLALWRGRRKMLVFLYTIITITIIAGALMYLVEGPDHGFSSIPSSMYWAVVTMATVGFGDIVPQSALGRFITSVLILIGYSIIAVPTGIYTAELTAHLRRARAIEHDGRACMRCGLEGHEDDARWCRRCGQLMRSA